jgi:hypothetical protein
MVRKGKFLTKYLGLRPMMKLGMLWLFVFCACRSFATIRFEGERSSYGPHGHNFAVETDPFERTITFGYVNLAGFNAFQSVEGCDEPRIVDEMLRCGDLEIGMVSKFRLGDGAPYADVSLRSNLDLVISMDQKARASLKITTSKSQLACDGVL